MGIKPIFREPLARFSCIAPHFNQNDPTIGRECSINIYPLKRIEGAQMAIYLKIRLLSGGYLGI